MVPGTTWKGRSAQKEMAPYPMVMTIISRDGDRFEGILHWPTLRDSKTTVRGRIDGNKISFTEYELIQGSNIALPNHYEGTLVSGLISGTYQPDAKGSGGVFSLEAVQEPDQ